jgi:hypothetical protein
MLPDYQIKILMLMHELENALVDLYEVFEEKFPEHTGLWRALVQEEQEHAEAVRTLYKLTYKGESYFDEGKIKPAAIQAIIDHVKGICDFAKQGKYNALQALSITYDIESALIAKDMFKCFEVSEKFADLLKYLQVGSQNHAQLAKAELAKLQGA